MGLVESVDHTMEKASQALVETRYFDAIRFAWSALQRAHANRDFLAMARVCLPLQEARRQVRQDALDAAERDGVTVIRHGEDLPRPLKPGACLVTPPMIGADGRTLSRTAQRRRVPLFVLTREPMTRKLCWPIVGLAERSFRAYVSPPVELPYRESYMCRDDYEGPISVEWFAAAGEQLGDAAIASVKTDLHPWWRVDDLMVAVDAVPEHEKLYQRLAEACRDAAEIGEPAEDRRLVDGPNMYSF